jgi:hypothetical protein
VLQFRTDRAEMQAKIQELNRLLAVQNQLLTERSSMERGAALVSPAAGSDAPPSKPISPISPVMDSLQARLEMHRRHLDEVDLNSKRRMHIAALSFSPPQPEPASPVSVSQGTPAAASAVPVPIDPLVYLFAFVFGLSSCAIFASHSIVTHRFPFSPFIFSPFVVSVTDTACPLASDVSALPAGRRHIRSGQRCCAQPTAAWLSCRRRRCCYCHGYCRC